MKNNNNQSLNESDMEQWRRGNISTQELQKRQAIQPVYPELAIPSLRALAGLVPRSSAVPKPDRSQEPSFSPGSITPRPGRQEPNLNLPSNDSPALSNMTAQILKKNEPNVLKPTPRGPESSAPFGKPHIVPRSGETPQQAIDRIQKAATGQSKLEEFEKNLQRVTNEYQKFKEQVGKPTFQATDAQLNDPNWMKARGLVPLQDLEASVKSADAQNNALASAADAGFPTYQYQGQTYGVKNPAYGKGGTTSQPQSLNPQQIQQTAGTNIVSGSGAPVTSGSKMAGPNAAGTSSGSLSNLQENQYRRLIDIIESTEKGCPPATQNIDLNLKNRKKAIDEYMYGPLDPNEPNEEYWKKIADEWNIDDLQQAKSARCGNCAAFDITDKMQDCIAQGIGSERGSDPMDTVDAGTLGYCKFLKFKCAAKRTCSAWVEGGPITD